jgi:hypothetical protein
MRPTRRQILEENEMVFAPPEVLRMFWRRYNTARRPAARMGDLAARLVASQARAKGGHLQALAAAWASILPKEIADHSDLESLRGGRLQVVVSDSATKFVLARQLNEMLVEALNSAVGKRLVREIDFRIGRRGRSATVSKIEK